MRRPYTQRAWSDEDDDPNDEDIETEADREPSGPPRRRRLRPNAPPTRGVSVAASLRRWRSRSSAREEGGNREDDDSGPVPEGGGRWHRGRRPVFFRARDSLYFEPLVALMVIILVLVSLWAYTQNWPPMYVVESNSMQHGSSDRLGLINTGDLVLAQKIPISNVVTYYQGLRSGYQTYGEYGDVILYHPYGITAPAPLIHRALLYFVWNPNGSYSAPGLAGVPCSASNHPYYRAWFLANGCGDTDLTGNLTLYNVGWRALTVSVDFAVLGDHSGFLTMGDNNPVPDQPVLSPLVEDGWVVGVARGMIPWFGAGKLLLEGQASEVPSQSWQYMGLAIIGFVLAAMGIHYVLRAEGVEDERRKAQEEAAGEESAARHRGEEAGEARPSWLSGLRVWRSRDEAEEEPEPSSRPTHAGSVGARSMGSSAANDAIVLTRSRLRRVRGRRGRPRPVVRRTPIPPPRRRGRLRPRGEDRDAEL